MPRVIGIYRLTLKDGVTPEEFEAFARNEFKALVIPGWRFSLARAHRGNDVGTFIEIQETDLATHDRYYAGTEMSEEAKALWQPVNNSAEGKRAWERWNALVVNQRSYTDYVVVED